jgi:uncharacterized protein (DUF362 family)
MNSDQPKKKINRRSFLQLILTTTGAMITAPFLKACQSFGLVPNPTDPPTSFSTYTETVVPTSKISSTSTTAPSPTTTEEAGTAQLAFVRTRDRAMGVKKALELLGINPAQGKQVLLKPNFNSADPAPASTHPDTLHAFVESLWGMGARKITIADRSGMAYSRDVMQTLGVFAMAQELGFDTLSFEDLTSEEDWVMLQPPGSHWQNGFPFARPALEAEALVQTCCLKPHRFGGHFTMSLKNSVGMVGKYVAGRNYMSELHNSPDQRLMIAEANTAYSPALILLDGVEAFIDQGPESGTKVWGEAIIAGRDRVAVDAISLALLRLLGYTGIAARGPIFQQDQIRRAVELGLGVTGPEKIRLLTSDNASQTYAEQI